MAAATLAFQLPFFDRWFSAMDEGHVLLFSEIAAKGGVLYRDATFYPLPGAFYLLALLFRLFEPSMLVARWAVVVEFALFAALLYDLLRQALPARFAAAVVPLLWAYRVWSFPHWQMYSYSTTALLLYALSLRLLVAHLASGRRAPLAGAGLCFGLGVFCKQDYGVAALLATAGVLFAASRTRAPASGAPGFGRGLATFLLPAAVVGLLAGLHFLWLGVLGDVLRFCVQTHLAGTTEYPYWTFPGPLPLFSQDPVLRSRPGVASHFPPLVWMLDWQRVTGSSWYRDTPLYELYTKSLIHGPWLVVAGGALRLWLTRARLREGAARVPALVELSLVATAAAFMLLVHVAKPQDYTHLALLTWPFFCLAPVYAAALWRARPRAAWVLAALLAPAMLAAFAYTGRLVWLLRTRHPEPVRLERAAGIHVQPGEGRMLEELVATVHEHSRPDQAIAVFPYFPILHFLADRLGPDRSGYIVWPFPEIEDRDGTLVRALEAQQVPLVIYHFTQFLTVPRMDEYAPALFEELVQHYEMFRTFGADRFGYKLAALRREEEPRTGRPLLASLDGASLRVEQGDSRREILGAERDAYARLEDWPFRPALALRPTAGGRSVLAVPVRPEAGAHLRSAVGANPERWFAFPPSSVSFRIDVLADGRRETLFERTLDPHRALADRGWFELDVPLGAYAGRDVVLELSTSAENASGETLLSAGFALPRLATESPEAASGLRAITR